jgi:DNA adenine methylase
VRGGPFHAARRPVPEMVERAYHYFVASWLGMNGVAGTPSGNTGFARRFSSKGGDPAGRFLAAVESLPGWHQRLRGVLILSSDGIELCEKIEDRAGTVVYCDPPYLVKGGRYVHDFKAEDHERLAAALCRFKLTRCVVSYYEHEDLARLYPGWQKVAVGVAKGLVNVGVRTAGRTEAPEVLLVNQAPATSVGLFKEETHE